MFYFSYSQPHLLVPGASEVGSSAWTSVGFIQVLHTGFLDSATRDCLRTTLQALHLPSASLLTQRHGTTPTFRCPGVSTSLEMQESYWSQFKPLTRGKWEFSTNRREILLFLPSQYSTPSLRCSLCTFLEDAPIRWSKKVWRRDTQFGHKVCRCLCFTSVITKQHPAQGGFQQPVGQMIDPVGTSQCLSSSSPVLVL